MTIRREPVSLSINAGEFVLRMRATREATTRFWSEQAKRDATWEPHDWSEWT